MNRRTFLAALGAATATRKFGQLGRTDPEPESVQEIITTLRYPYVQNIQADRATVIWTTAEAGFGTLQYSIDDVDFRTQVATSRVYTRGETGLSNDFYQYQADLAGLHPGADYVYQAYVNGITITAASELRFRTAGPGPFSFLVMGDTGWGSDQQFTISQKILAERPSFVIHTGDIAYTQNLSGAGPHDVYQRRYLNYYAAAMSSIPFFPCPGNHDYDIQGLGTYLSIHSLPSGGVPPSDRGRYYSYDWGNVHFTSINSNQKEVDHTDLMGGEAIEKIRFLIDKSSGSCFFCNSNLMNFNYSTPLSVLKSESNGDLFINEWDIERFLKKITENT